MPALPRRDEAWRALARGCDVLVIGGGITGAGVALDAALRGYRVVLVERGDFAGGTSSRSTKLVHGGLRYLPQGQLALVREALTEREILRRLAPGLVRPLGFVLPLYAGARRPLGLRLPRPLSPLVPLGVRAGLYGYDLLGGDSHRRLRPEEARRLVPPLRTEGLRAAFLYHDAQTDDVALTHAVLRAACAAGAVPLNYAEVVALRSDPPAALVVDRMAERGGSPPSATAAARHIVNAAGVWADRVASLAGPVPFRIERSKGTHLVLDAPDLLRDAALVIPETDDGRLAFAVPWSGRVVLGTTDDVSADDPDAPRPLAGEARYLLDHLNRYLDRPVGTEAVVSGFSGFRPLIRRGAAPSAALARSHEVIEHPGALVSIIGGKLTTYRRMAEDTVDALVRRDRRRVRSRTAETPLGSGEEAVEALAASDPTLGRRLPAEAALRGADVVYACRAAQCVRLADFMVVRSRLAWLDRTHGLRCVEEVARLMAAELGWSPEETERQIEAYRRAVAAETAFLTAL